MNKKQLITKISVSHLRAELNQPFRIASGEHLALENLLFTLQLNDGTTGYGEAAIADHITGETLAITKYNLEKAGRSLVGKNAQEYLQISAELHDRLPRNKAAIAAMEMALLDALTRQWKMPLWKFFGDKPKKLKSDVTIVIGDLAETEDSVRRFHKQGFRIFKVKIGRDKDLDFKRLLAVKRLAPRCPIYLDANQGYTAGEMLKFLKRLEREKICPVLLEQPVPRDDWEGLKFLSRSTKIPVCADESVRSLSDAVSVIRQKICPAINIKFMKSGVIQAREIAFLAKAAGIKLMIGAMMESALAITASAHLAAGMGCFDYVDLDTPYFIKGPLGKSRYATKDGVFDLRGVKAGIGIEVRI